MIRPQLTPIALALGLALTTSAFAQQAARPADSIALTLGEVLVSSAAGGPLEARRVLRACESSAPPRAGRRERDGCRCERHEMCGA